jgi:hypothetical protein
MHTRREAGDTLIEVTFALTILASVLAGSTTVVARSFQMAQVAKERTAVTNAAQQQAEALRSFYTAHLWSEFLGGATAPVFYAGVLTPRGSAGCHTTPDIPTPPQCFHMAVANTGPSNEELPADGPGNGPVPTSYVEIVATPDDPTTPTTVTYTINYGFEGEGGGVFTGHIDSLLTGISGVAAASPTGGADLGPAAVGSHPPPPGGSYYWDKTFLNLSPAGQQVNGCLWDWGDGTTSSTACNAGDTINHTFPTPGSVLPYPGECNNDPFTVTLTEYLKNGLSPSKTYTAMLPNCN